MCDSEWCQRAQHSILRLKVPTSLLFSSQVTAWSLDMGTIVRRDDGCWAVIETLRRGTCDNNADAEMQWSFLSLELTADAIASVEWRHVMSAEAYPGECSAQFSSVLLYTRSKTALELLKKYVSTRYWPLHSASLTLAKKVPTTIMGFSMQMGGGRIVCKLFLPQSLIDV